jgi:hypothetical protein
LRTFATCEYIPALHRAAGHVATARATGANPVIASIPGKICILDEEASDRQPSVKGDEDCEQTAAQEDNYTCTTF